MNSRRRPSLAQYTRETVLDAEQCADWIGCSEDQLERSGIPAAYLGERTRRYIVGVVLDHLAQQVRRAS